MDSERLAHISKQYRQALASSFVFNDEREEVRAKSIAFVMDAFGYSWNENEGSFENGWRRRRHQSEINMNKGKKEMLVKRRYIDISKHLGECDAESVEMTQMIQKGRLCSFWYNGEVARIKLPLHPDSYLSICASGDVNAQLFEEETEEEIFCTEDAESFSLIEEYLSNDEEVWGAKHGTDEDYYLQFHKINQWEIFLEVDGDPFGPVPVDECIDDYEITTAIRQAVENREEYYRSGIEQVRCLVQKGEKHE